MAADIGIRNDVRVESAGLSLNAVETLVTWLYPGKIPERLRLVKK